MAKTVTPAIGLFCSGGRCVLVSIKHNSRIVAKVVNPLGTVVTLPPNDQEDQLSSEEAIEEAIIHENCDEALFRPVVPVACRPVVCLQPKTPQPISLPEERKNDKNNIKNQQRYQGLKSDEIVHNIEDVQEKQPISKRNRKSKQKQDQTKIEKDTNVTINKENKVVEQLPVKELCNSLEKILFSEEKDELKDDNKDMWSSVEKLLPEHPLKSLEEDSSKDMWSSIEHCKMDENVFAEMPEPIPIPIEIEQEPPLLFSEVTISKEKSDDDLTPNNNSSETTESDDSTKNKVLVSVAETLTTEDNTANSMPISNQSNQKSTKKKAKKKRK